MYTREIAAQDETTTNITGITGVSSSFLKVREGSNGEGPVPPGTMLGQSRGGEEGGVCRSEVAVGGVSRQEVKKVWRGLGW